MFEAAFEDREQDFSAEFAEGMDSGGRYNFGDGLAFDVETRTLSVDCADSVTETDKRPVSASAVWEKIGDIETVLKSI